jgi:hypothetical protein
MNHGIINNLFDLANLKIFNEILWDLNLKLTFKP